MEVIKLNTFINGGKLSSNLQAPTSQRHKHEHEHDHSGCKLQHLIFSLFSTLSPPRISTPFSFSSFRSLLLRYSLTSHFLFLFFQCARKFRFPSFMFVCVKNHVQVTFVIRTQDLPKQHPTNQENKLNNCNLSICLNCKNLPILNGYVVIKRGHEF